MFAFLVFAFWGKLKKKKKTKLPGDSVVHPQLKNRTLQYLKSPFTEISFFISNLKDSLPW